MMLKLPNKSFTTSGEILLKNSLVSLTNPGQNDDLDGDDKTQRVTQLLTSIPDSLIKFNHEQEMPVSKEFLGVTMFADISGFTALTEKYSAMESEHAGRGTDKLCATLNTYIGMIVDEIVSRHGDVLKFAGDAILALWKFTDIGHNAKTTLNKVINCCFDIQEKCDNFMTEVGVVLRVKLAVAVGSMCLTIVGLPKAKQFDLSGSAIIDVGKTEKEAVPGSIILSQLAWTNCDQNLFTVEPIKGGEFLRVTGLAHFGVGNNQKNNNETKLTLQSTQQRLITSDIDYALDKVLDYRQDMPKALQPDTEEEKKISTGFFLTQKLLPETKKKKKKKKFDRLTMTYDLRDDEILQLRAYVQEQVLYKLDHGQNLDWLSEMRQVSVLFINMELPAFANEASMALQKSFEVVYEGCEKFSGTLNKVFSFDKGCTFIVIFGLPGQKEEDDAIRALKCAHYIFESLHALPEISNESIGVTTGLAFCGVVGHKDRHEYTVIGSKVNMAARLMMFYPKKLTCDNDTYESARMRLREEDFITQPYVELKGLKDPGVVREYDPRSTNSDDEEDYDYPILGRKEELKSFNQLLDTYSSNRMKKVVVITGEHGIGKARLLDEFMDEAAKKLYRIINVQLNSQELIQHIGSNLAKLLLGNTDEERQAHYVPMMQEDQEMKDHVGLVSDIVGNLQTEADTDHLEEVAKRRKSIIIKTICKYLDKQKQNHFIAIDKAMILDDNSWVFLEDLLRKAKIIIAFTIRSTELTELSASARRVLQRDSLQLPLTGLNRENMVDFVCQLLHVNKIPKKLRTIIESNSHGIPSWCEQLIKNMLYSNLLQVVPLADIAPPEEDKMDVDEDVDEVDNLSIDNGVELSSSQFVMETLKHHLQRAKSKMSLEEHEAQHEGLFNQYQNEDYVNASPGAIVGEVHKVCILSPNADVNAMLLPDSEEDMVLARMDKMSLVEQTVIKCAAVLGMTFSRDLLKAIIPKNCANMLDTTLQNLSKMQFFTCASLLKQSSSAYDLNHQQSQNNSGGGKAHHFQAIHQNVPVMCGCYASDGFPTINLLQSKGFPDGKKRTCYHYQFCKSLVQETAFNLWLEDQRNALFEKAALYLETTPDKCRACGGNGFIPGVPPQKQLEKSTAGTTGTKRISIFSKPRLASVARPDKNLRLQDLKKAIPNFPKEDRNLTRSGDVVGMALVKLAALYNQSRNDETTTTKRKTTLFLRKKNMNSLDSEFLALETALKNFCNSNAGVGTSRLAGRDRTTIKGRGLDLSQCQCLQLQALTIPRLVHYWKSIGSKLKAFQYSIELASLALDTNDSVKALDTLKNVDEMIKNEESEDYVNFTVSDEDRAKIESLKGQALCMMDCYDDGVRHFTLALEYLKSPPPVSTFSFKLRLWRASMVQLLHQKMPGVFVDTQREYSSIIIEQTHILSNLAKAYRARREFDKAYLANLEQLNAAEEIAADCWREVMIAYSDMIGCLHVYGKESMGPVLERAALQHAEVSTVNMEDMLAVGNLHLSLLTFYSHIGDISKAYDSGAAVYNVASSLNDAKLLVACIPQFVHVSIMKMRFHSSDSMVSELGAITSLGESRMEKWIYYCCCIDMLLHVGDYTEMVRGMATKLMKRNIGGYTGFAMNYVSNGLALWYARQNSWANAMNYYIDAEHQVRHHSVDVLFYCNALAITTEFLLHRYRHNPDENTASEAKNTLKLLQKECSGKGFLEARLYHFQAYFAYLKKKFHRARLLLDESLIVSKNNDWSFDYEWTLASKNTWFVATDAEKETTFSSGIKYLLPTVK